MRDHVTIDARWDGEANVWLATSADVPGLVVEAESWSSMVAEVPIVVAELLEVQGKSARPTGYTFRAEEHLELASIDGGFLPRPRRDARGERLAS